MFRKFPLVLIVALLMIIATTTIGLAQDRQVFVYSVPGRILHVDRGVCGLGVYDFDQRQYVCQDQIRVEYLRPDGYRQRGWIDAYTFNRARRPYPGDVLNCEIDSDTYALLDVSGWYRPHNFYLYFRYAPPYHRHYYLYPEYRRHHQTFIYPPRYRQPNHPPYRRPIIRQPRQSPLPRPQPVYDPPRRNRAPAGQPPNYEPSRRPGGRQGDRDQQHDQKQRPAERPDSTRGGHRR